VVTASSTTGAGSGSTTGSGSGSVVLQAEIATAIERASKKRHVVFIFFSKIFQVEPSMGFFAKFT
jgi:hypothetical protein